MADLSGRTLGEFTLREQIGEGGYGTVYRAEQPLLEREVVVKVLREERGSPDARERFLREARLAAQLRHPYAAQIHTFGTADGGSLLWIAMERVQGVSLADWLDKNGRMPLERFVPFFECVAQVVQAAHDRGIVHRDLKPSNIMVVECGDRLTAKLLDLGIARGSWKRRSEIVPGADDTDSPSTAFMLARALQPRLAEQAQLASTAGRTWSAAFSPDGRQIVTTDDRAAQVWDARTYRRMFVLFHGDTVYQALYSPDGARIVTAGGDGTVKIWDAATGALVRELRHDGARLRYFIAALSPDGRLVAAIDDRGDVAHVWDETTGALVAEIRNDGLESPGIAFSADGHWFATTGGDDVRVLDARTWRQAAMIRGPRIHRLAFDPTGARLLTGATTGDAAVWSVPGGARILHLRDAGESVDAVVYSPDGRLIAAGSHDGAVQVWRAGSGKLQSQLSARHGKVLAVEFDRASELVLATVADGAVVVAEAAEGTPVAVLEGPRSVLVGHFDPGARRVVGASLDGTARVWDATPPYRRWSSPPVADDCKLPPSSTSDGRFVAVGCQDHPTRVWDTAHDQLLAELPGATPAPGDSPSAYPAVSRGGDRAAVARGSAVEVYELSGGRLLRTIAHGAPVSAVAFAPTGRDLVSGATDGSLVVTRDGGARLALPAGPGGVDAVGFLSDGRVVAADAQRRLRVFDPGGAVLADLEIPTRVRSLRVYGTRLVGVPYADNAVPAPLVDLGRYRVVAQLEGHAGQLLSARWVAGGQILTAGTGGTAQLWDGSTGRLLQTYRGSSRFLADATLTADGLVVAGGADGLLRFWDKDSGYLLWTLPAHKSEIYGVHAEGGDIVTRGITGELVHWTLPSPGQVIEACGDQERCAILLR